METEDYDMHMCLVCQTTISGLMNYVNHKKSGCIGKKSATTGTQQNKPTTSVGGISGTSSRSITSELHEVIGNFGTLSNLNQMNNFYKSYTPDQNSQTPLIEPEVSTTLPYDNLFSNPENGAQKKAKSAHLPETPSYRNYGSYDNDANLLGSNNDISDIIPAPQDTGVDQVASEKVDDFFLSLELRSKFAPQGEKNAPNLPISNILNNLTFSSDEEDLGFNFADDVSIDSLSDDSDVNAPPRHHTGGKWKPGQGPGPKSVQLKRRLASRGKWPPGERISPKKLANKRNKNQPKRGNWKPGRSRESKKDKSYSCNFCNKTFSNRFIYSSHCGSAEHKLKVFGQNKPVQSYARGGKAKSISMMTREKQMQYDSDTTEDYDNVNEEQNMNEESEKVVELPEAEKENEEVETTDAATEKEQTIVQETVTVDIGTAEEKNDKAKTTEESKDSPWAALQPVENQPLMSVHICTICDKKYNNKYVLSRHLLTKLHKNRSKNHPDAVPLLHRYHKYIVRLSPFQCLICRYFFNTNEFFESHMKSQEHAQNCSDLIGEIKCSICSFKTHLNEAMIEHIDSEDHKKNISKCNKLCVIKESHVQCRCKYCGLVVRAFSRLKRHIKLKHPNKEITSPAVKRKVGVHNRPTCKVCQKTCHSESALRIHVRRRHTGEKPFKCNVCSKAFTDRGGLDLHYKSQKHAQRILQEQYSLTSKDDVSAVEKKDRESTVSDPIKEEQKENNKQNTIDEITSNVLSAFLNNETVDLDADFQEQNKVRGRGRPKKKLSNDEHVKRRRPYTNKIKCKHCDVTVPNYNDLRPHYLKEHSAQVKICELCDMVFLSARSLRLHYLSRVHQKNMNQNEAAAEDTKYYKCPVCLKKFTDQRYCKFHTEYQHNHINSEEQIIKLFNGKDATRVKYREFLLEIELLERTATVQCPDCHRDLKKNNLMDHLRMHTGEKLFTCRLCHRGFISSVTLRRHLLGHFGCQDCTCDICGKSYKKLSTLEQHMSIHQMEKSGEQKMHICDVCGQSFYFESQLNQHSRRHQDRKFRCPHPGCHWKFVFKNELAYHLRSHSQEKPYLCDICGYAANTKVRLQRHKITHTGERKYHCEYCTYKAGNSTHLHRHMRIHIGSKPYKCPYCDYSCNTHENIRKHIAKTKKHEGMKIYPCKLCTFGTNSSKEFRNHLFECHECEVEDKNLDVLSSFTGLYSKVDDPKRLAEGMQVIQVKEKTPRNQSNSQKKKKLKVRETSPVRDEEHESIAKAMLNFSQDYMLRQNEYSVEIPTEVYTDIAIDDNRKCSVQEYQPVTPTEELNHVTVVETIQERPEPIDTINHYRNTGTLDYQRREMVGVHRTAKQEVDPKREVLNYDFLKDKEEAMEEVIDNRSVFDADRIIAGKTDHEHVDQKFFSPSMMSVPGSVHVMLTPVRPFSSYAHNQDVLYQPHAFIDEHGNDVTKQILTLGQATTKPSVHSSAALSQQVSFSQNTTYNPSVFQQSLSPSKLVQPELLGLGRAQEGGQRKSILEGQKGEGYREIRSLLNRQAYKYNSEDFQFKEARRQEQEDGDGLVIDMSTYIQNA